MRARLCASAHVAVGLDVPLHALDQLPEQRHLLGLAARPIGAGRVELRRRRAVARVLAGAKQASKQRKERRGPNPAEQASLVE